MPILRSFLRNTSLGRVFLIPFRFALIALPQLGRQLGQMLKWAFASKEYYNHTYHLTDLNKQYLASYIAAVTGHDVGEIEQYVAELENDSALRELLVRRTLESRDRHNSDAEPRYGRRLGWYALVRATKPRVIVETGIDRGLGTVVMAAALKRNTEEGFPGLVYATDIVPDCGHLLAEPYKQFVRELIGDSVESLKKLAIESPSPLRGERDGVRGGAAPQSIYSLPSPVDVFLHDSDHRPEYEWAEFLAIEPKLHAASIVMSDNSQQTSKLREFAARIGKSFLYFQDAPRNHWWPGDGIGCAFVLGKRYYFPEEKP